jgi:hypothetical protein
MLGGETIMQRKRRMSLLTRQSLRVFSCFRYQVDAIWSAQGIKKGTEVCLPVSIMQSRQLEVNWEDLSR